MQANKALHNYKGEIGKLLQQPKTIMLHFKIKLFYAFHRVAVNMHWRIVFVGNVQAIGLKINKAAFFINNIYPLHFMKPAYLH